MKNGRTGRLVVISALMVVVWVALGLMIGTRPVLSAATFTVTNTGDNGGVDPAANAGTGTLRQAIVDANATAGADTINFQGGVTGSITLASSLPQITQDLMINGPGQGVLTVSGNNAFQVFNIASGVTAAISGLTISNGHTSTSGGGISNAGTLTVTNSTFSGNSAQLGGGIYSEGTLIVTNGTFSSNSASSAGGGIDVFGNVTVTNSTFTGNSANINGGGIFSGNTTLAVTNSSFTGNSAGGNGGGILNGRGTLTVTNSTFSGNSAGSGGGIQNNPEAGLLVTNSTFSSNSASGNGGGISNGGLAVLLVANSTFSSNSAQFGGGISNFGTATFKNSIIANSTSGGNCAGAAAITAVGVNYSTDNTCAAGFTVVPSSGTGGLNLGPLQDNGGTTWTRALMPGSIAIDAVTDCTDLSTTPATVTTDQRGFTRPRDGDANGVARCDAGAFELQPCTLTCPANSTRGSTTNQCGAVVTYAPTTGGDCFTITCTPASGSFFPIGMTTVNCDSSATSADPDCSFTVTVNDTQPPSITCPANVTVSTAPNLCSATVSYSAPTVGDNCLGLGTPVCSPASGSMFSRGTTTVTCNVMDASGNAASCSFTVTVNDTQPPVITCPANVMVVSAVACPPTTSTVVTFPTPTPSDNCPGVTVACNPPSGSALPVGTTTVTCTATDASGNTTPCSFMVTVFNGRLQDDSDPSNVLLFNTATGDYRLCCGGMTITGKGTVLLRGCTFSLQHNPADRRLLVNIDFSLKRGTAYLQSPPGVTKCTITDRNMTDDTSTCP